VKSLTKQTDMITTCTHLLLALAPIGIGAQETVIFNPEEGSTLEKVWTTKHTLLVTNMNRSQAGAERAVSMTSNGIGSEQVLGAVDEYLAMGPAQPQRFRRTYHKGRRTTQMMRRDKAGETSGSGEKIRQKLELRGTSVIFTWVPEKGEYGKYYDESEFDEIYLPTLRPDLDLAFLLPSGPVESGDVWTLPAESMIDLLGHGGTLPFAEVPDKDDFLIRAMDSGVAGGLDQVFGGDAAGDVEIAFQEVRELNGRRLAVLTVTCDVHYERDRTEFVQDNTIRLERREGIDYLEAYLTVAVKGSGEILWDVERNIPFALVFAGEETVFARVTHHAPMDPEGTDRSQNVTLTGGLQIQATFTPGV
jgi:hypothetical protein